MMRSLFSGVSGLKIHQTKMDVIGNNIANVNTIGFKSSTANFADVFYQNLQAAKGPNPAQASAGTNPMQIGLGANLAAINVNVTGQGGTQRTDRGLDLMINGEAFFVVQSEGQTYFSKAGALNVDPNGNLYSTSNGATIMGWQADAEGNVIRDTVSALRITSPDRMFTPPEATTYATLEGAIDPKCADVKSERGHIVPVSFYDQLGNSYTMNLSIKQSTTSDSEYTISISDIVTGEEGKVGGSFLAVENPDGSGTFIANPLFGTGDTGTFRFGGEDFTYVVDPVTRELDWSGTTTFPTLTFNGNLPDFVGVSSANGNTLLLEMNPGATPATNNPFPFEGMEVDFSAISRFANGGNSAVTSTRGDANDGYQRAGFMAGQLDGFTIDGAGIIYGIYTNGQKACFGQIALATFPNAAGLEAVGNSLFRTTLNSGDFDGVGVDPSTVGGLSSGALEMSNVDLATEFTSMITTQRGFQANSRIITTSDTMLEELLSLKR